MTLDNSNRVNSSGTLREGVADTASRAADAMTGRDDDVHLRDGSYNANTMNTGSYTGARYYAPNQGRIHLSGLFDTRAGAENAVAQLESLGVPRSDISVIYRDDSGGTSTQTAQEYTTGSKAGEGAGTGSVIGGTLGAILGALAATATSIAIPGVGILIAGPIAGALAGAGMGGLTGGLLGALVGAGIPEETARTYEAGLNAGGVVVVADVPGNVADQARMILNSAHF